MRHFCLATALLIAFFLNGSVLLAQDRLGLEQCVRTCYHQVVSNPARVGDCVNLPRLAREINRSSEAIISFIRGRIETSLRRYPDADITNLRITHINGSEYSLRGTLVNGWMGIPFPLRVQAAFDGNRCMLNGGSVWGITIAQYLAERVQN